MGFQRFFNISKCLGGRMKRFLLSLIVAGGLALMAAPQVHAQAMCGSSYAMLMTGDDPSFTPDGALTAAVGVGQITFGALSATGGINPVTGRPGPGCSVTHGELIYNSGDVELTPTSEFFAPANCYTGVSYGAPCFNGADQFAAGGTLSAGGPGGAYVLSFAANYGVFDTLVGFDLATGGPIPFGFFVQNTLGSTVALGASIADPATNPIGTFLPGNGAPILNLTLQKQRAAGMPGLAFGTAPFLGASAISCSAWGANSTDGIAAAQSLANAASGPTITGAFQTTLGSFDIFATSQAGGELTFNSNNSYTTAPPTPNSTFCPFYLTEQNNLPGPLAAIDGAYGLPAAIFADGAANEFASMEGTFAANPDCALLATAGAGYTDSSVQYGVSDQNSYVIVTGLFGGATYFVPVGGMSYCSSYEQSPITSAILTLATATIVSVNKPATGSVKVTNNNEVVCDLEISMPTTSNTLTGATEDAACTGLRAPYPCCTGLHTGTCATEMCTLSLVGNPVATSDVGPSASTQYGTTSCTCNGLIALQTTSTLTISSLACPVSKTATITCKN
jgi:hypothetical protein